jgi:hypothetical protein
MTMPLVGDTVKAVIDATYLYEIVMKFNINKLPAE